jgi:hypothetical protein
MAREIYVQPKMMSRRQLPAIVAPYTGSSLVLPFSGLSRARRENKAVNSVVAPNMANCAA